MNRETRVSRIAEMQERIHEYRDETGVESPEDAVLQERPLEGEMLQEWQTTRRNLGVAKVVLALREAEDAVDEERVV